MNTEHTQACVDARAGHLDSDGQPDEYPVMRTLTAEGRDAVLACPHRDHDLVRAYARLVG